MDKPTHLLIVDDDREIRTLLSEYLREAQFRVSACADGQEMRATLNASKPDLIILDVMMPGEDGLSLCRWLRANSAIPIIMLTARGDPIDRVLGLELGADDYVPKPFEPRELLARIKSVLRRSLALPPNLESGQTARRFSFAGWRFDLDGRTLTAPDGAVVSLSGAEYRMLEAFVTHPNRVLSRDQLMEITKGREADPFDRAIDLQVSRLRQKLGDNARDPQLIKTVRSEGYVFAVNVATNENLNPAVDRS